MSDAEKIVAEFGRVKWIADMNSISGFVDDDQTKRFYEVKCSVSPLYPKDETCAKCGHTRIEEGKRLSAEIESETCEAVLAEHVMVRLSPETTRELEAFEKIKKRVAKHDWLNIGRDIERIIAEVYRSEE